jgi:hypothetical protein
MQRQTNHNPLFGPRRALKAAKSSCFFVVPDDVAIPELIELGAVYTLEIGPVVDWHGTVQVVGDQDDLQEVNQILRDLQALVDPEEIAISKYHHIATLPLPLDQEPLWRDLMRRLDDIADATSIETFLHCLDGYSGLRP